MLQHIHIENLAVIEEADISFDSGLNVLTGETGAGKSIVIDALNMVLGERSSRDLVRTGCDKAEVTALFAGLSVPVLTALTEMGYDCSDGQLLCRRRVTAEGKSTAYINGAPVTVALLRQIGRLLVNMHGQHDNQALLSEDKQRDYLDAIGGLATLKETGKLQLTPHMAWASIEARKRCVEETCKNIAAFISGEGRNLVV